MATTLRDIANKLGVSHVTVSYALRNHYSIPERTRERVRMAALELGYRPNSSARSIRSGKFSAIGVLQAQNLAFTGLGIWTIAGIQEVLMEHDLRMVMSPVVDFRLTDTSAMPRLLREWSVDGLLVFYNENAPAEMSRLIDQYRLPAVWVNTRASKDAVYIDDYEPFKEMTKRLLSMGHSRILYASSSRAYHYSRADRRAGYEAAMSEAGLLPWVLEPEFPSGSGLLLPQERLARARVVMSGPRRPTAVVTYGGSDDIEPFLIAAMQLGMKVPGDLALVGVDDGKLDAGGIELATLCVPTMDVGRNAARMLLKKLDDDGGETPSVVLPLTLFTGSTFTPPATGKNELSGAFRTVT